MARGTDCVAHKHDSQVAQERHHVQPLSRGGPNNPGNLRWLCANAHGDAHYLLDHIEDRAAAMMRQGLNPTPAKVLEAVPWALRRTFGPSIRDIAAAGWTRYARRFLAGEFWTHRMLWYTSGQPRPTALHGMPHLPYSTAVELRRVDEMVVAAVARYGSMP